MRRDPELVGRGHAAAAAVALLVVGVAVALWIFPFALPVANDGHALTSMSLALSAQLCGLPSHVSSAFHVSWLVEHPEQVTLPLRDVVLARVGSVEAYCKSAGPFMNNENSLMLLMRPWFWLVPNSSVAALGRALLLMKVIALAGFCYALWRTGMTLLVSGALLVTALVILHNQRLWWHYSVYPFVFVVPLLAIALYVLGFRRSARSSLALGVLALGMGVFSAFGANIRTSHLPIYLILFGIFTLAVVCRRKRSAPEVKGQAPMWAVAIMAAGFFAGYAAFMYACIRPLYPTDVRYNASYHVIFHPLVLSLAVPENPLSKREGIQWNDAVGGTLAQRMIPDATYLGPHYEAALCLYYLKLWMLYPEEMGAIYRAKFELAGRHMLLQAVRYLPSGGPTFDVMAWPAKEVTRHVPLLVSLVLVTIASLGVHLERGRPFSLLLTLLAGSAAMFQLESVLIYPYFVITYHSYLLFCVLALSLFAAQGVLELARLLAVQLAQRWPRNRADGPAVVSHADADSTSALGS